MDHTEFSQRFDVLYNNITSNQAPGLNEYEKSVFLTKGQDEYIKNQFYALSNPKKAGFDSSRKRHTDFAGITKTVKLEKYTPSGTDYQKLDPRALMFEWPSDVMFVVNEQIQFSVTKTSTVVNPTGTEQKETHEQYIRQIVPISYDEYTRLMSRPYKQPYKYQAWRFLTDYTEVTRSSQTETVSVPIVEIILCNQDLAEFTDNKEINTQIDTDYILRYVRIPSPIILEKLSSYGTDTSGKSLLSINGESKISECELHESVHEEILQRAVELAKLAWEGTSQAALTSGQRSE